MNGFCGLLRCGGGVRISGFPCSNSLTPVRDQAKEFESLSQSGTLWKRQGSPRTPSTGPFPFNNTQYRLWAGSPKIVFWIVPYLLLSPRIRKVCYCLLGIGRFPLFYRFQVLLGYWEGRKKPFWETKESISKLQNARWDTLPPPPSTFKISSFFSKSVLGSELDFGWHCKPCIWIQSQTVLQVYLFSL